MSPVKKAVGFIFTFVFLFVTGECGAQLYQWVDDKGTLHFSESPPPDLPKSSDKTQDKSRDNSEKPRIKDQSRNQTKKTLAKNQPVHQEAAREKTLRQDDTQAILKRLEFGNRQIPEDLKKYAPAAPAPSPRDSGGGSAESQPVRRSSS